MTASLNKVRQAVIPETTAAVEDIVRYVAMNETGLTAEFIGWNLAITETIFKAMLGS